jgi:hypothetical protein
MAEIGFAGRANLVSMRLGGIDIGLIEKGFVRVRIVTSDFLDQIGLAELRRNGRGSSPVDATE